MSHAVEDGVSDTGAVNTPPADTRPSTPWRETIDRWYRPLIVAESWLALGYLAVGALWAVTMLTVVAVMASITFSLVFVVVGLFLIVPTFALVNAMVGVERSRAGWVGQPIAPRPLRTSPPGSWFRFIATTLTDPERWRQVGFIVVYVIAAPLLFTLALTPWIVLLGLFFGLAFDVTSIDLVGIAVGLALAGAAPRITVAIAGVTRSFVAWFLGPDPTSALQDRVDELAEQRTVILDAVDAERRRIERNLHDGVQQQLVALGIDIGRARSRLDDDPAGARQLLDDALTKVRGAVGELRVIGRGLHPAVLEDRGLDAALSSIVGSASIPISVEVSLDTGLPDDTAATAYYVVNESVANILKHANARTATVRVGESPGPSGARAIRVAVSDDGRGGADAARGTGLAGIRARVEGADGTLQIDSPPGGPTTLVAVLPIQLLPRPLPPPSGDT